METIVNIILDESGSMSLVRDATIDGFNKYVGDLKKATGNNIRLTLTKFSSVGTETPWLNKELARVSPLTRASYAPNGGTPLLDAIGGTIAKLDKDLSKRNSVKRAVLVVVITDGEENASTEYNLQQIRQLIAAKEKEGWTWAYMGADQDAWGMASGYGFGSVMNTYNYANTASDVTAAYASLGVATLTWKEGSGRQHGKSSADFFDNKGG
ncbi:hypothetical protein LCGC14_2105600 [marine sediment metagenome]|uniref:VWFA domain-containing protein n=1 Tax=marine sediment metagenome TaxID=412755 RepID=A0A0F9GLT7_9ZZZZ